jgi:hypothetical protein
VEKSAWHIDWLCACLSHNQYNIGDYHNICILYLRFVDGPIKLSSKYTSWPSFMQGGWPFSNEGTMEDDRIKTVFGREDKIREELTAENKYCFEMTEAFIKKFILMQKEFTLACIRDCRREGYNHVKFTVQFTMTALMQIIWFSLTMLHQVLVQTLDRSEADKVIQGAIGSADKTFKEIKKELKL